MKNYEELTFSDSFMFAKVTEDPKNCKRVLESLLGEEINLISEPNVEKELRNVPGGKYVRLDLYAEDDKARVFDAEMQNYEKGKKDSLPKRSRYYQAMLDSYILNAGEDYKNLNESFIIFICRFDPFGKGLYRYTFKGKCEELSDLNMGDGATLIFFNTKGDLRKAPEETRNLLKYVETGIVTNKLTEDIDCSVKSAIESAVWKEDYMLSVLWRKDAILEGREEGLMQGREEGLEQGREEGLVQGREEGIRQGRINVLVNMIQKGLDKSLILDLGYTEEEYSIGEKKKENR